MKLVLEPLAPLEVEIPPFGTYTIPAPTRDQVERATVLRDHTVRGNFSLATIDQRRREELYALLEPEVPLWLAWLPVWLRRIVRGWRAATVLPVEKLHPAQVAEVVTALVTHYFGQDPALAVAVERAKKKTLMTTAEDLLTSVETAEHSPSSSESAPAKSAA